MTEIKLGEVDPNYHTYLTEKLDHGEPNIVVDCVLKIALNESAIHTKHLRIADFGCFTGSVINRVYLSLPPSLRQKTSLVGFDSDVEIVKEAARNRPQISFYQHNLIEHPPKIDPFQIGLLSNVLHEIYSLKLNDKKEAKTLVTKSLKNVHEMLAVGGFLVILDGILPDNQNIKIDVDFLQNDQYSKFIQFAESDYCIEIPYQKAEGLIIQTTLGGLAAFLVKSRYLDTTFWEQESRQVYDYFTIKDFQEVLNASWFEIENQNFFKALDINEKLKILDSSVQTPHKNILIVAKRKN